MKDFLDLDSLTRQNWHTELHKQHQDKLEDITGRFDGIKMTLSEKVETLRSECDRLRDRAKHCEEALQRNSDFKVQCALAPYRSLPQEVESLKTVLEMKNKEINKLRTHNIQLQKKLEELPLLGNRSSVCSRRRRTWRPLLA
ncbi:hypothetical protein DPMN_044793 [Dreissena polymorpha]|uniref:Uncharacterized protein n=1 Tax=Dreissena polymorpha TaxID=45954 RepID=A0A9D4D3U7_DREPO|nr:hypothetical protein DPMN_044793 [Dreissena polymorpha]